jgi:phosphomannomutase
MKSAHWVRAAHADGPKTSYFCAIMADQIKFGTDGWRAIIARDYTEANVRRVALATARWMRTRHMQSAVVGHDCRFGGEMFAEATARVLAGEGIQVFLARDFVSTPMVSLGVVHHKADMGVVITASHNPPSYNGYKLKSAYGGPTVPVDIAAVEALMPEEAPDTYPELSSLLQSGQVQITDLEDMYIRHVEAHFDMVSIRNSGIRLAYDAMYGAGQRAVKRLLPAATVLHGHHNPGFYGRAPEPIHRNLHELSELLASSGAYGAGLANDGDADRIGMYDSKGHFVDSHHLLLLLLIYLYEYKGLRGKVVVTFSVTDKMEQLARQYGLDFEVTRIGFKYIAEIMTQEDVLLGGEESGGLAAKGHIPERDGVWMGLLVLEFMALTGKRLDELVDMVYAKVGPFAFDRLDLHVEPDHKQAVIEACRQDRLDPDNVLKANRKEDLDGFKYYLPEGWLMFRPSGTEPVLRIYAQGRHADEVTDILQRAQMLVHRLV